MQTTIYKSRRKIDRLAAMWEDLLANPVAPEPTGKELIPLGGRVFEPGLLWPVGDEAERLIRASVEMAGPPAWRGGLDRFFGTLLEPADREPAILSPDVTDPEGMAPASMTLEAAHEESLSFSSPFRWEPKPAWLDAPARPNSRAPGAADAQNLAFRPKIPLRPLHKQRFYRRFFFYLRGWLSRSLRKTV